jgi:hypothetical protein
MAVLRYRFWLVEQAASELAAPACMAWWPELMVRAAAGDEYAQQLLAKPLNGQGSGATVGGP